MVALFCISVSSRLFIECAGISILTLWITLKLFPIVYLLFTYVEVKTMTFNLGSSIGERSNRKLFELAAALVLITGFIFIFEPLVDLNVSLLISLIVLLLACLWSFYLYEGKAFFKE